MKKHPARTVALAVALAACLLFTAATAASFLLLHFDLVRGVYSYDPRSQQPSTLFLSNRPEQILVESLARQTEKDGSYPPGEKRKLVRVEPLHVELATYSDWASEARVTVRLEYSDGTSAIELFRFRDSGSEGILMPVAPGGEMSIHARFGNLGECSSEGPGKSYCGLNLGGS